MRELQAEIHELEGLEPYCDVVVKRKDCFAPHRVGVRLLFFRIFR